MEIKSLNLSVILFYIFKKAIYNENRKGGRHYERKKSFYYF